MTLSGSKWLEPVFLMGAQRTGSTLVGSMLASLPNSSFTVNGKLFYYLSLYIPRGPDWRDWLEQLRIDEIVHSISRKPPINVAPDFIDRIYAGLTQGYEVLRCGADVGRPEALATLMQSSYRQLGARPTIWGDKYNEYALCIEDLDEAFPRATWIWTTRDINASGKSAVIAFLGRPWAPRTAECGAARARRWSDRIEQASKARNPLRVIRLSYEELVAQPARVLGDIDRALGLDGNLQQMSDRVRREWGVNDGDKT